MLEKSQNEFGRAVGVSGRTIQQIENGLLKISPGLAQKISQEFGLDPAQLIKGDHPENPKFAGRDIPLGAYTHFFNRQEYETRKKADRDVDRAKVDEHIAKFSFALEVMLDCANHAKCYGPFIAALMKRLMLLAQEFGLLEPISQILSDYTARADRFKPQLTVDLFAGSQIPGMLKNRDALRPWLYGEIPKENKPLVPPTGPIAPFIPENIIDAPLPSARKQAARRSSRKGKSPKKPSPPPPQRDRGSAVRKPSGSRRGRAPG